jgi:DNA-directed RNA polymerase subunit M/transcription elongation factor TFIIS
MSECFNLKCPSCSNDLEVEGSRQEWEGQVLECPGCQTHLRVSKVSTGDPRKTFSPPSSRGAQSRIRWRSRTPAIEVSAPATDVLFQCPKCKGTLCVSHTAIGRSLPCTACNAPVIVYKPSVRFNCIKCNSGLSAFGTIKGKSVQCPNCQETTAVPSEINQMQ